MASGRNDGFVDKNSKEVIPLIDDYAEEFTNGRAKVKKAAGKFSLIKQESN